MPFPRHRSRSMKRKSVRRPKKGPVTHYARGKPAKPHCSICNALLAGIPKRGKTGLARLTKTERRPERAFAGVLCHECLQQVVKQKTRLETGALSREDVDLRYLKFIDALKH